MTMRTALLSCALAFGVGVIPGPRSLSSDEKAKIQPATVDLSGRWM